MFSKICFSCIFITASFADDLDVFSSTADLEKLLHQEDKFRDDLESLATKLEDEAKSLRQFIERHYEDLDIRDPVSYVSNPVNSLNLIKRLSMDLDRSDVKSVLSSNETQVLRENLNNLTSSFPSKSDWLGATNGIFLLQEHYSLNITKLSDGLIENDGDIIDSQHAIGAEELLQIGVSAVNEGYMDTGVEWIELAKGKLLASDGDIFISEDLKEIDSREKDSKRIHDHMLDHRGAVGPLHRCNRLPFDSKLRKKKKYKAAKAMKTTERAKKEKHIIPLYSLVKKQGKKEGMHESSLRDNFEDICKGVEYRTADMEVGQKCRHLHHHNPYTMLGPFKLEELSKEPYITVIREMMYDSEMEHFKAFGNNRLERSGHGGKGGQGSATSFKRTSKQSWLEYRKFNTNYTEVMSVTGVKTREEAEHLLGTDPGWGSYFAKRKDLNATDNVAEKVSNRMELATTFNLYSPMSSESFQIANYGLGGQYSQHLDPHGHWEGKSTHPIHSMTGDRLSTIMVYLTDVKAGGATAFPNTGNRIPASRGDAAFWINMKTSGMVDKLTHHGGCPVLVGSKWITNKWVGYLEQFTKWKCSKNGWDEKFQHFTAYF